MLAAGLAARGFAPGDVFAIFAPNLPEYAVAFHGVAAAGGANTTINSLASVEDVASQLHATRARYLLTVEPFLDRALPAARKAGVQEVFVLGPTRPRGRTPFAELLGDPSGAPEPDPRSRRGRRRDADVQRDHGLPEGRAAHAPQPRREHDPVEQRDRPRPNAT